MKACRRVKSCLASKFENKDRFTCCISRRWLSRGVYRCIRNREAVEEVKALAKEVARLIHDKK